MGPALPASAALTLKLRTSLSGQGPAQGPTQGHPDAVGTRDRKIFYQCFKMRSSALSHKRVAPLLYFTVIFTHQKKYLFSSGSLKMLSWRWNLWAKLAGKYTARCEWHYVNQWVCPSRPLDQKSMSLTAPEGPESPRSGVASSLWLPVLRVPPLASSQVTRSDVGRIYHMDKWWGWCENLWILYIN